MWSPSSLWNASSTESTSPQPFGEDAPSGGIPLPIEYMDMDMNFDLDLDPVKVPSFENLLDEFGHDVSVGESGSGIIDVRDETRHNQDGTITRGSGSARPKGKKNLEEYEPFGKDAPYNPSSPCRKRVTSASEEELDVDDAYEDVQPFVHVKPLTEDTDIDAYYYRTPGKLGEGMFGATYEVVDVNNPQIRLAMKVQTKKSFWFTRTPDPEAELLRLYKELLILNRILPKHKNIIQIKDMLVSPNNVYIVTELCEKLNLDDFSPVADNTSGRKIFKQLVDAIHFIHEYGVVHADLKSDNVLFADSEFMECKVIDFGVSVYWPDWATKVHNNFDPRKWFEDGDLLPQTDITHLDDIKGLGRILHNIMCGKFMPFMYIHNYLLEMRTTYKPRLEVFDEAAMNLLEMIGPRPFGPERDEDYPTMDQICQHPWLVGGTLTQLFTNRDTEFALLQNDLTVLQVLLKDWAIMPLIIINEESELEKHYQITGSLQRGSSYTRLMECTKAGAINGQVDFDSFMPVTATIVMTHAMKILYRVGDQSNLISADEAEAEPLRIYNELLITLRILPKHEHIVDILDVIVHREYVLVVRDLCERLTLEDFFPVAINDAARNIFRQLAETVRFMHLFGVVHMDLHCHHIVFTDQQFANCKIVDFSKARYVPQLAQYFNEQFQPGKWITPELSHMSLSARVEVDVRALGRLLHAMMIGTWEPDPNNFINLLPPQVGVFDDAASDLLSKIGPPPFGPDVGQRTLTMDEICLHPWLADEPQQQIYTS